MEHLASIKLMPTADETDAGNLELELYWDGTLQVIKIPEDKSFFISHDEVIKLIDGLQKGLAKILPRATSY